LAAELVLAAGLRMFEETARRSEQNAVSRVKGSY